MILTLAGLPQAHAELTYFRKEKKKKSKKCVGQEGRCVRLTDMNDLHYGSGSFTREWSLDDGPQSGSAPCGFVPGYGRSILV
jgi:hypothetical protein